MRIVSCAGHTINGSIETIIIIMIGGCGRLVVGKDDAADVERRVDLR